MKRGNKKDKVSYYVGWGIAYGTFAGGMFSILSCFLIMNLPYIHFD